MNAKIVGFILSKSKIEYIPKLNRKLRIETIDHTCGILSIFYYGDICQTKVHENSYSMGFPASKNLLDHNLLIQIFDETIDIENDWLGSIPVFYNEKESIVSSFPKVCLTNDKSFDDTGLYNYLRYGFSVFEQTPFVSVKFLSFYTKLSFSNSGIEIISKEDPVKRINEFKGVSESNIWSEIDDFMAQKESLVSGDIIIPTSAGFDSRIINYFTHQKERIKNYSYGISSEQSESFEVIEAKKFSEHLGHSWQQVSMNEAFNYMDEWHDLYSFSTHIHGMYHIEFYNKVKQSGLCNDLSMVSGICGGVFSGSNEYSEVKTPQQLYNLAFTHGLNYQPDLKNNNYNKELEFLDKYDYLFKDIRLYPVITMRIKLMLLSYLMTIPSVMGIPAWTPFLNFNIVMKMLNIPTDRRKDRLWVKDFFKSKNLLPNKSMFFQDTRNTLNFQLHMNHNFQPISNEFQIPFVDPKRLEAINNYLGNMNFSAKLNYRLTTTRIIKELVKKIGINNQFSNYLTDYQTLKALELSL